MVTRAGNFLAEALAAYSSTAGSGAVHDGIERRVITRLSYNSSNWQRPTGDARKYEASTTYNHRFEFGHEDWLFRSEWQIDGWRYGFLQGVNRHHRRLIKERPSMTVTLFTIEPEKRRRFVATIHELEVLDEEQARDAVDAFKESGWYDIMRKKKLRA